MWTIVEDTVGRHDFLLTPCSPDTFTILYGNDGPSSELLRESRNGLAPFGIRPDAIPTSLNVFMNVDVLPVGRAEDSAAALARRRLRACCAPRWT